MIVEIIIFQYGIIIRTCIHEKEQSNANSTIMISTHVLSLALVIHWQAAVHPSPNAIFQLVALYTSCSIAFDVSLQHVFYKSALSYLSPRRFQCRHPKGKITITTMIINTQCITFKQKHHIPSCMFKYLARFLQHDKTNCKIYNTSCIAWYTWTTADYTWCVLWVRKSECGQNIWLVPFPHCNQLSIYIQHLTDFYICSFCLHETDPYSSVNNLSACSSCTSTQNSSTEYVHI